MYKSHIIHTVQSRFSILIEKNMSKESYTVTTTVESKIKQLNQKKITKVKRN